jgi:hypothetical protein
MHKIKEDVDIKQIIKDLQGNFAKDNEAQMKSVQLLKGLATSDEELANKFMQALDKATTEISKEILGEKKEEINQQYQEITIPKDVRIGEHILEAGDRIRIMEPFTLKGFADAIRHGLGDDRETADTIIQMASAWTQNNLKVDFKDVASHVNEQVWKWIEPLVGDLFLKEVEKYLDRKFDNNPNIIHEKSTTAVKSKFEYELKNLFKKHGLKVQWTPEGFEIILPSEDWYWHDFSASGGLEEFNELIAKFNFDYDIVDGVIVIFVY